MSTSVQDIFAAFQQGADALQRLPEIEARNRNLANELEHKRQHVQRLEQVVQSHLERITTLEGKVKEVQTERDDASFRELEAADRVAAMGRTLRAILAEGEGVLAAMDATFVKREEMSKQFEIIRQENVQLHGAVETANRERDEVRTNSQDRISELHKEIDTLRCTWREPDPVPPVYNPTSAPEVAQPALDPIATSAAQPSPSYGEQPATSHETQPPAASPSLEATDSPEQVKEPEASKPWWEQQHARDTERDTKY